MLTQCVKVQIAKPIDAEWKVVGQILRDLEYKSAQALNYCMTQYYLNGCDREEWKREMGKYPTYKELPSPYLYPQLTQLFPSIPPLVLSQTEQVVKLKWKQMSKEVLCAQTASLPTFKKSHPITFHNQAFKLLGEDSTYAFSIQLCPKSYDKTRYSFALNTKKLESGQKTVLDRIVTGEYKHGAVQLLERKNKWFVVIPYSFESRENSTLDPNIRVGVDLGISHPAVCAVNNSFKRLYLKEEGATILSFNCQIYNRRRNVLGNNKKVLDRRSGHGRANKLKPIKKFRRKIEHFRETANHRISKAVVNFALDNHAGVLVLEDLSNINSKALFLKNWPYYDLQEKIRYKAKREGITVEIVKPVYTSQRCSRCGYIAKENRKGHQFKCISCGQSFEADYNAAYNLATPEIEKLIEDELKFQRVVNRTLEETPKLRQEVLTSA